MSNLLKGFYLSVNEDTRVVDSNDLVQKRVEEDQERRMRLQAIADEGYDVADGEDGGFTEGLFAQNIDDLMDEEADSAVIKSSMSADSMMQNASMEELNAIKAQIEEENEKLQSLYAEAQNIIDNANAEAEGIKENAYNEASASGYEAGYNEGMAAVESMKAELEAHRAELDRQYQTMIDELEPLFIDKLTDIYQHIFGVELEQYSALVKNLLIDTINSNSDARNIIIHISKADYPFIMEERADILTETGMQSDNVEFVQDATLNSTDCIIETDNGVFDCSLDTELKELKRKLLLLSFH